MLREERLTQILEKLDQQQRVSSTQLMAEFQVSEGTIRRDLNELAEKGLLRKVHGGAVPRPAAPKVFSSRQSFASDRKANLAQKAVGMLEEGQLLLMDGGTSNWHLANILPNDLQLTVFTNSFPIATTLMNHPGVEVHFLGGKVFQSSQVTVGLGMLEQLNDIRADLCFLGVRSIHPELGLTTLEQEEALIKRRMVQASDRTAILATTDKLGTVDHYRICDLEDIQLMVVEAGNESDVLLPYQQKGLQIW